MVLSFASLMIVLAGCSSGSSGTTTTGNKGGGLGGLLGGGNGNSDAGTTGNQANNGTTNTGNNTNTGGTTTGGTCKLTNMTLSDNACGDCQAAQCCSQWQKCDGDASCMQLVQCIAQCTDSTCQQQCYDNDTQGHAGFDPVLSCAQTKCDAACN